MDPISITTLAIAVLRQAIPAIQDMVKKGQISPEQQAQVLADYKSLINESNGQFSGPEWEVSES